MALKDYVTIAGKFLWTC